MRILRIALLAAAFLGGLYLVAWWTVPLVAGAYALLRRDSLASREAAVGALIATVVLLMRQMLLPAFSTLLSHLGQIFPVPGIVVLGLSLLLAMVLAFTSARVVTGIVGTVKRR
ncbi:MAG: hypothetical protein V4617_06015 [Gemmatimonadota bacterium]